MFDKKKPPCSRICRINEITRCVPYLSSSQKIIIQEFNWIGDKTTPFGVFNINSGVVADAEEKLRPTTSKSGRARSALRNVIVFPLPGGPQRTNGFFPS